MHEHDMGGEIPPMLLSRMAAASIEPRLNFAPLQRQAVIRLDKEGRREPVMMHWGLLPLWSKDDKGAAKCINAKAETVGTKPSFRAAFRTDGMLEGR